MKLLPIPQSWGYDFVFYAIIHALSYIQGASLASLAQSQGVMSWLGSVTLSVAYARFARSLTWA